jgi:hypothetical protein
MPMYQFRCPEGHEFEKIVNIAHEIHKWCKHCNRLTIWKVNLDPHTANYKEKLCSECLGTQYSAPVLPIKGPSVEEGAQEICPTCGKPAEHVLRIEKRGSRFGGPTVANSSVRFHFNYAEPTDS